MPGMHRIFSGRITKSSSRRDLPSFLTSLVAVTNTPSDVTTATTTTTTTTKDIDETGTNSEKKAQDADGASSGSADPATATSRSHTNQLISFYTDPNGGRDSRDRTLSEILCFSNDQLEYHHDYIQWLFPLPEPSPYNWNAPKIDQATAQAFRTHVELRDRLRESLVRMLSFYGFEVVPVSTATATAATAGGQFGIQEGLGFPRESAFWIRSFDHNHLRITRIIRSLRVLGLDEEAKEFYRALVSATAPRPGRNRCVSPRTLMFWKRAAKRPLQVPPEAENYADEEEEEEGGKDGSDDDDNKLETNL